MSSFRGATALLLFSSVVELAAGHGSGFSINPSHSGAEINVRFGEAIQERDARDPNVEKRQACGPGVGSCPAGQCCSSGGQCGTGGEFCTGPGCQLAYGPACDGNTVPPGASTLNIGRTEVGSLPYGQVLYQCSTPNTIALTFDDGPWAYTQSILDTLANYNVHATFFITGNNGGKGRIDDPTTPWPAILKSMHAAGHQLASHTWSHEDLTAIPANLVQNQIIYNEMAFRNIFGWVPTYLRPPYGSCDDASTCLSTLNSLGYHIITWDVDTKDYLNDDPTLIQNSKNWFAGNVSNPSGGNSYIELSHDIHQQTALTLVSFMLDTLIARGYKAVAVGECMGDPSTNWYRDAGGVPASLSPSPTLSPSPSPSPSPVANTVAETNATTTTSTSNKPVSTGLGVTALAASSPSGNAGISIVTHSLTSGSSSISTAVATNVTKSEASVKQISIWLYGLLWACSVITALGMGA